MLKAKKPPALRHLCGVCPLLGVSGPEFPPPSALKKATSPHRSCRFSRKRTGGREAAMNVDHEVKLLVEEIHRLGSKNADGKLSVKFGVLFQDDKCANLFEALVGTLKAAKRRKIITYSGELLLQGVHDDVDIILLQD
ncbi:hypothetical protein CapIbe_008478 [Capra ibex]